MTNATPKGRELELPPIPFAIRIPSRSDPDKVHTITRHPDGTIKHSRGCPGFENRGTCWHVTRAIRLAEFPAETFVADVLEAWGAGGMRDDLRATYALEVRRAAEDARNRVEALARWRRDRLVDLSRYPTHDDRMASAFETFAHQQRRAAR